MDEEFILHRFCAGNFLLLYDGQKHEFESTGGAYNFEVVAPPYSNDRVTGWNEGDKKVK